MDLEEENTGDRKEWFSHKNSIYKSKLTNVFMTGKENWRHGPSWEGPGNFGFDAEEVFLPDEHDSNEWHDVPFNLDFGGSKRDEDEGKFSRPLFDSYRYGLTTDTRLFQVHGNSKDDVSFIRSIDGLELSGLQDPIGGMSLLSIMNRREKSSVENELFGNISGTRLGAFFFVSFGGWEPNGASFIAMDFSKDKADLFTEFGETQTSGIIRSENKKIKDHNAATKEAILNVEIAIIGAANPAAGVVAVTANEIRKAVEAHNETNKPSSKNGGSATVWFFQERFGPNGNLIDQKKTAAPQEILPGIGENGTSQSMEGNASPEFRSITTGDQAKVFIQADLSTYIKTQKEPKRMNSIRANLGFLYQGPRSNRRNEFFVRVREVQ